MTLVKPLVELSAIRKWKSLLIGSVLFFLMVYGLAVWTKVGQTIENSALRGSRLAPDNIPSVDDAQLRVISVTSLAVVIVTIAIVGYVRGGWRLGIAGSGTIAASVLITEALKHLILPRPDLIDASEKLQHNTLPSGHTTIAMSFLLATLLVVSYRWRGLAMLVAMGWATGIGALTIGAHWHRLSDTLAANAVALAVASVAALWLARTGDIRPSPTRTYPLRAIYVAAAATIATLSLGAGALLMTLNWAQNPHSGDNFAVNNYYAAHSLAFAASIVTALLFWYSWRRLETGPEAKAPNPPAHA